MPTRRSPVTAFVALLAVLATGWSVAASGALQVRACLPEGSSWAGAHIAFLRPAADCPSGVAWDDGGVFAIVGSVALAGLLSALLGVGLLSGATVVLRRLTAGVLALAGAVLPGLALLRGACAPLVAVARPSVVVGPQVLTWKSVRQAVVGLRAPPVFA